MTTRIEGVGRGLRALFAVAFGEPDAHERIEALMRDGKEPPPAPLDPGACAVTPGCTLGMHLDGACVLPSPRCDLPPAGWRCTRAKGHAGPCAAVQA